jgi:hypothetical protein
MFINVIFSKCYEKKAKHAKNIAENPDLPTV